MNKLEIIIKLISYVYSYLRKKIDALVTLLEMCVVF